MEGLDEVGNIKKILIYPKKSKAMNLAFDVTPAKYITGLITEKGICDASTEGLKNLFKWKKLTMIEKKNEIIEFARKLNTTTLWPLRSGNISVRGVEDGIEGFFITPSGKKYETLKPDDIVFMELNDEVKKDSAKKPSSEWRFHRDIYLNKKEAEAIVHAHSPHATAVSSHGKPIPPFHYMIALAGGEDIKCADYATFGTEELSNNVIEALRKEALA